MPLVQDQPFENDSTLHLAERLSSAMGAVSTEDFKLLSTMRYTAPTDEKERITEDKFFLLDLHLQRMLYSIRFFKWNVDVPKELLLDQLKTAVGELPATGKVYKLRILLSNFDKKLTIETYPIDPNDMWLAWTAQPPLNECYRLFLDTQFTPAGAFTAFKTTKRDHYNEARLRALHPEWDENRPQEVLLFNQRDDVMEGSITNVAFKRGGYWCTPPLTSGALCGVMRRHLLDEGYVKEQRMKRSELVNGEWVLMFNAVRGLAIGELSIREDVVYPEVEFDETTVWDYEITKGIQAPEAAAEHAATSATAADDDSFASGYSDDERDEDDDDGCDNSYNDDMVSGTSVSQPESGSESDGSNGAIERDSDAPSPSNASDSSDSSDNDNNNNDQRRN